MTRRKKKKALKKIEAPTVTGADGRRFLVNYGHGHGRSVNCELDQNPMSHVTPREL